MTALERLDPELRAFFGHSPMPPLSFESLPLMRAGFAAKAALVAPASATYTVREFAVARPDGSDLRLLAITPHGPYEDAPALLHFHPGGWVLGSPEMSLSALIEIVDALNCVVVSVDYRLAPEHHCPAAADDGWLALHWLVGEADHLNVDPNRIGLMGESAGANLAAGLALRARDDNGPALKIQVLLYAALDDRAAMLAPHPHAGSVGLSQDSIRFAWRAYLGEEPGGADVSPYTSPARATSLTDLPRTFMAVGAMDPVVEENLDYARALMQAGVPTEMHLYPGAPHGFDLVADATVTKAMSRDRIAALKRAFET